jgi:hypothetical protein
MMEVAGSSKALVMACKITRCFNPKDYIAMKISNLKLKYFKEEVCLLEYNAVFRSKMPLSFQNQRVSQATNLQEAGSRPIFFKII